MTSVSSLWTSPLTNTYNDLLLLNQTTSISNTSTPTLNLSLFIISPPPPTQQQQQPTQPNYSITCIPVIGTSILLLYQSNILSLLSSMSIQSTIILPTSSATTSKTEEILLIPSHVIYSSSFSCFSYFLFLD